MNALGTFFKLEKVDAQKRLVYGVATAEAPDRSGEICDYATTKPYYEAWSADFAKASNGKSLGNVRAMHSKIAAGRVEAINFDDDAKRIEIVAKVIDDAEWKKVVEGVYTGFSQGGEYVKRWKDEADPTLQRYTQPTRPKSRWSICHACQIPPSRWSRQTAWWRTSLSSLRPKS